MITITPYMMAKVVNEALGTTLPPQMFYQYAKKGYIQTVVVEGKKKVTYDEVIKWTTSYATRNKIEFIHPFNTTPTNTIVIAGEL